MQLSNAQMRNEAGIESSFHTDESAHFQDAFTDGYQMTRRFLLARGAAAETAEEIAQAAWVKGWEHRDQLRNPDMLGAWINSIAKNMFRNEVRSAKRFGDFDGEAEIPPSIPSIVDAHKVLSCCPGRDGTLLSRYYLEGYTTEEIARTMGICPTTIRVRLLRIRRTLRERLAIHQPLPS